MDEVELGVDETTDLAVVESGVIVVLNTSVFGRVVDQATTEVEVGTDDDMVVEDLIDADVDECDDADSIAIDGAVVSSNAIDSVELTATIDVGVEDAISIVDAIGAFDRDLNRLGMRGRPVVRGPGDGVDVTSGSR